MTYCVGLKIDRGLVFMSDTRTNAGVLYAVDMRLRPSGRAGPVATRIGAFADYQENEAWTWEHLALTRARVVASTPEFAARVEAATGAPIRALDFGGGFVLVPAEATDAMVQAAGHIDLSYMPGQEGADWAAIYRAMIAAAQEPKP